MGMDLTFPPNHLISFTSNPSSSNSHLISSSVTSVGTPLITTLRTRSSGNGKEWKLTTLSVRCFWTNWKLVMDKVWILTEPSAASLAVRPFVVASSACRIFGAILRQSVVTRMMGGIFCFFSDESEFIRLSSFWFWIWWFGLGVLMILCVGVRDVSSSMEEFWDSKSEDDDGFWFCFLVLLIGERLHDVDGESLFWILVGRAISGSAPGSGPFFFHFFIMVEGSRISTGAISKEKGWLVVRSMGGCGGSVRELHRAGLPWVGPATVTRDILTVRSGASCVKAGFASAMVTVAGITAK